MLLRPVLALIWVAYGFGYTSDEFFGGKSQPIAQLLRIRIGFWCTESSDKTSNKREFHNLWNHVKEEAEAGRFTGHEVCIGTYSKVAERIWYKGGSADKELYEIILEMREISLKRQILIHLIHVDGSRIIYCGVDRLSCGDLQLEKLDEEIYIHLPVDRDSISRSPTLLPWILVMD